MSGQAGTGVTRRKNRPAGSEPTRAALAFLHDARSGFRQQQRRSTAPAVYGLALVGALWGVPALAAAAGSGHHGAITGRVLAGLPSVAPALLLLVLVLMARGAMWRGPVVLNAPTVSWLLPTPAERAHLLLPRLRTSALLTGTAGLVAGGASGFLLHGPGTAPWPAVTAGGAWAGAATALTGSALGALVERHAHRARHAARIFGLTWALVAVCAVAAVASALGGHLSWAGPVLMWSGPWGWAAQPLVAATGTSAPGWGAAAVLSLGSVLAALALARREVPHIPRSALRLRATAASQVGASLSLLDLRQARAGIPALKERGARPALRLPVPRRPGLILPWRDATGLLRAPGRLGWAAAWTLLAVALTVLAPTLGTTAQSLAVVTALTAEYLAAAQLTEPARVESDDIRRSAALPFTAKTVAARHTVIPGILLLAGLGLGAAACALLGQPVPGLVPLVASAPAFTTAALVSSYRGVIPAHVMIGTITPMGDTGPFQAALWYLRGPLAALLLTAPVLLAVTRGGTYGIPQLIWHAGIGAAGLWWARRTAHRLHS